MSSLDKAVKFRFLYLRTTKLSEFFLSELISDFFSSKNSCVLTDKVQAFSQFCTCVEEGEPTVQEERSEESMREMKSGEVKQGMRGSTASL